jgi:hypothetical protein
LLGFQIYLPQEGFVAGVVQSTIKSNQRSRGAREDVIRLVAKLAFLFDTLKQ